MSFNTVYSDIYSNISSNILSGLNYITSFFYNNKPIYQSSIDIIRKSFKQLHEHLIKNIDKYSEFKEYIHVLDEKLDKIKIVISEEKDNYAIDKLEIRLYSGSKLMEMVYISLNLLAKCTYPNFGPDDELLKWSKFIIDNAELVGILE